MHAKPDLRVFLKWMIAGSGSVITDVMSLVFMNQNPSSSPAREEKFLPLPNDRDSSGTVTWLLTAISILGLLSIAGQQLLDWYDGNSLSLFVAFPLVWLCGFTVYPGYILGLVTFPWDKFLCLVFAAFATLYYTGTIVAIYKYPSKRWLIAFVAFVTSVLLNLCNGMFVNLLHL